MEVIVKRFTNDELYHHGIKGMKWGVRRFQKKDGSLTPAGKKRYDIDVDGAEKRLEKAKQDEVQARKKYNKATLYGSLYDERATKALVDSTKKTEWAKQDLKTEKIKEKLNNETKSKSKHRQKLEQHYLDKGMTQEEAEVAAYQRAKTEKILAVTAGLTVAAAAAYIGYKQYDKRVDRMIKSGTVLQNISGRDNKGVSDAFYASMDKLDNTKYRGMYGSTIQKSGRKVYEAKIGVNSNLKIASEKSAVNALSELVKNDPQYAKTLRTHLEDSVGRYGLQSQEGTIKKGLSSLRKGKIDANVYNALNLSLVDHNLPTSSDINKGFYDKLKSKGYDAIIDINDKKLSGYGSKKPVIVFNGSSKLSVDKVTELGRQEIAKARKIGMMDVYAKALAPSVARNAGIIGLAATGTKVYESKTNDKIVREYRKEHPNTKLSYKEIIRNHET